MMPSDICKRNIEVAWPESEDPPWADAMAAKGRPGSAR